MQVVQRLCDVVSKNGNLLLSIPVRGNGTIDSDEEAIVGDIARWFAANGDAIYGTRPWRMFGEGPTRPKAGFMNEGSVAPFTSADIRFTSKNGVLHAALMDWPEGKAVLTSLGTRAMPEARIERVELLGHGPAEWTRDAEGMQVALPRPVAGAFVPVLRIYGRGIA
jgi:alpha-L-fucosidase